MQPTLRPTLRPTLQSNRPTLRPTLQSNLRPNTVFCRDNLDVLGGINSNCIDLIYLDPPFNKGKQFHAPAGSEAEGADFNDIWREESVKDEWHGEIKFKKPKLYKYLDAVGEIGNRSTKYYLIYMAVRLFEIYRILKETGNLYLHCDTTMSHYLKILLDCIFGINNFKNEIIWRRDAAGKGGKRVSHQWPRSSDVLLLFYKGDSSFFHQQYTPLGEAQQKVYRYQDEDGRFYKAVQLGNYSKTSIQQMTKEGLIHTSGTGKMYKKYYLDNAKSTIDCIWDNIYGFGVRTASKERTGYPTQKPLALLERIIQASCPVGGLVLDPFCGCATTCIAASRLGRKWIGIDIAPKTFDLVKTRLQNEVPPELLTSKTSYRTDIPVRTDMDHKRNATRG